MIDYPYGGEHYLKTKELVPDRGHRRVARARRRAARRHRRSARRAGPGRARRSSWACASGLDLYVNLRPVKLYARALCPLKGKRPQDVDFVVVRENTEDAYAGIGGIFKKGTPTRSRSHEMIYTRKAYRARRSATPSSWRAPGAAQAGRRQAQLTLVDKANAIRAQDLWTRAFAEVAREYPDVKTDHAYVDACCMWMVKNPEWFDVIVTTNMFGDIITDLGAMIQGGMGIAASGNIHPGRTSACSSRSTARRRSTPGQNVANPLAAIVAVGMMLDHLGEPAAAARIEGAVSSLLRSGAVPSVDTRSGISTTRMAEMVLDHLRQEAPLHA